MAAGRWVGRGDKIAADQAAVDAMRLMLDTVSMQGVVVIGEGEKDEAPMLFNGEEIGDGHGPAVDVAVDPLEGTRLTALGQPNAIAVIAVAERGSMFFPGAAVYMNKIAVGPEAAGAIDIDASPRKNVEWVAKAKGVKVEDVSVVVLERDRHEALIRELRDAGAKVNLIRDGDVAPAIAAARGGSGVDMLMGVGGTPEGVISAAALKCVGGALQGKLWPRSDEERQQLVDAGFDLDRILTHDDLVASDNVFVAATGVTDGNLLRGVRYGRDMITTDSIVMRSRSGTVRRVEALHEVGKLAQVAGARYGKDTEGGTENGSRHRNRPLADRAAARRRGRGPAHAPVPDRRQVAAPPAGPGLRRPRLLADRPQARDAAQPAVDVLAGPARGDGLPLHPAGRPGHRALGGRELRAEPAVLRPREHRQARARGRLQRGGVHDR